MQYFFSFGFRCACSGRRESAGGLGDQTRSRHPSQANDWLLMRCVGHSRSIDSRSATGRPGSESYAPSQGLAVATRATEKELNKYPGNKNIVLVYRTIIYVYDIRAVELIECPRRRTQPSLPGGGADPGFGTERGCWSQSEGRVAHVRGPRRWGRLSVMTAANR